MAISPLNFVEMIPGLRPEVDSTQLKERQLSPVEYGRSVVMNNAAELVIRVVGDTVKQPTTAVVETHQIDTRVETAKLASQATAQSAAVGTKVVTEEDLNQLKQQMGTLTEEDKIRARINQIYGKNPASGVVNSADLSLGA